MLYALICYNDEKLVSNWTQEEDDAVMQRIGAITGKLAGAGKLGPCARLVATTQAKVLRKGKDGPIVTDGPFAESKEHLLGFYLVDCQDIDEAVAIAKDLQKANAGPSSYDIRPVMLFVPGSKLAEAAE
jgi:hypothetical protein